MRKPIIAGNWKMHKTKSESVKLAADIASLIESSNDVQVVICPTFVTLDAVREQIQNSPIQLGAQTLHFEESGAYTGEISAPMLKAIGCQYVIIGHSERRQYFGETNPLIHKKLIAALKAGLTPILCVGETFEERKRDQTFTVIETQLREGLENLNPTFSGPLVVAYEPVWAIGTGKVATPQEAQQVHSFIRKQLATLLGASNAERIQIQYGGSVKPDNIQALMQEADIDGALVGGASLEAASFVALVKQAIPVFSSEPVRQTLF